MSYQFPDQPQGNFGAPMPQAPAKKGGSGTRTLLIACGLFLGLCICICICCVGAVFLGVREPTFLALFWGAALQDGTADYNTARGFTCEGSQAERLTDQYEREGVTFSNFESNSVNGDLTLTATLNRNGGSEFWEATATAADGGPFGRCLDTITVLVGN